MKRLALPAASLLAASLFALAACGGEIAAPTPPVADPAPAAQAPAPTPAAAEALTSQGWGPVKVGMTKADVIAALGPDANPDAVGGPDPESCEEFHPTKAPEGLWVMIEAGKVARISITELSPVKTDRGFGLGDKADAVKAAYGAAAIASPHKYQDKPAEYITVWDGAPRTEPYVEDEAARGIVYEIDGTGGVGMIHVGGPAIQYVEGCA